HAQTTVQARCRCFAAFPASRRTISDRSLPRSSVSKINGPKDQVNYDRYAIADSEIPQASARLFQHLLRTYASEANKLNSVWLEFPPDDLSFKPHARSSSVREIIEHELLSERRFFAEFLGLPEPPAAEILPEGR